jgi:galactokinase
MNNNPNTEQSFFAPGRVNLIGDHTDYNGGLVLPVALSMGTYLTLSQRDDQLCHFSSDNDQAVFELDEAGMNQHHHCWVDYPLGVVKEFADRGYHFHGHDFHFHGNMPIGAALSSSASIEVVTALALNALIGKHFSTLELVKMAQHAENDFVGMNCGIMDQFAAGFGKDGHAIALDCNTMEYEYVPLAMEGLRFVICNSKKKRGLVDSAYNQRRRECQQALEILQRHCDIQELCQLEMAKFQQLSAYLSGNLLKRARHAVSENERVKQAIQALKDKDMATFGQLMNASHASLRDDYEVSCPELDFLVEHAQQFEGVLGSRMTGAGFGGCTVTLIAEEQVEKFIEEHGKAYKERFGVEMEGYIN